MKLLDQFIAQTAKKPAEWASQDIQQYLNYVGKRMSTGSARKTGISAVQVEKNGSTRRYQ